MRRFFTVSILEIAFALTAIESNSQDFHVSLFPQNQTVPTESLRDIYEDETGFIWVASDAGLYKFNGRDFLKMDAGSYHSFKNINEAVVLAIGRDKVVRINAEEPPTPIVDLKQYPGSKFIYDVVIQGELRSGWLLTDQGVVRFSGNEFSTFKSAGIREAYSGSALSLSGDTILLLTPLGHLHKWKDNSFIGTNHLFSGDSKTLSNRATSLPGRTILLDSTNVLEIRNNKITSYYAASGLPGNFEANDVSIWKDRMVIASPDGLWLGNHQPDKVFFTKIQDGSEPHRTSDLPFSGLRKITCSKEGNMWLICNEGIALLQERPFRRLSKSIPLASFEQSVFMQDGKIFLESDNGIFECIKNDRGEYTGRLSSASMNQVVAAIAAKNNRLWISALDYSVYYYENGTYSKHISIKERGNSVFFMFPDHNGNVWISQAPGSKPITGILKITPDLKLVDYGREAGFENRMLITKENAKGVIYCAGIGPNTYLYRYDSVKDNFVNISVPMNFDYGENFEVHDMAIGPDEIWLATTAGLLKYTGSEIKQVVMEELYDNEAVAVTLAKDNSVWVSTDRSGVVRYDRERYTIFTQKAGLASNSMTYRSINVSEDGTIWASSQEGLFISPLSSQQWRKTKTPMVLGVRNRNGEEFQTKSFPYNETLKFDFVSLSYPVESIEYSYRLKGFNNDRWTNLAKNDSLVLTNLKNGSYILEIRAKQVGGYEWSDPRRYGFKVDKVWYLQTNAILVYIFTTVMAIIAGVQIYNKRLRIEKKILERKVLERTKEISIKNEEILNKNEEISAQIEELKQMSDEIATQRDNLIKQKEVIENQNYLLAKSKNDLEQLVVERTKDLSLSNQELVKQNTQLEQFAFMTAHNLRAPVAQLIGLTHIFDKNGEQNSFNLEVIRRITDSALNLDEVIHDIGMILQVKKGIHVTFVQIELSIVVKKVLDSFQEEIRHKKVKVFNKVTSPISVMGIEPYMHSVISNVISNSIKYTKCGADPVITIESTESGNQVKLTVADNGVGFDVQNNRDKLFKPFSRFTLDDKGKGLGLFLIKIQMDAMRGTVDIDSAENKGTVVTLKFPK